MTEIPCSWNIEKQMKSGRARLRILELPVPDDCRAGEQYKVAGSLVGMRQASTRNVSTVARIAASRGAAAQ